MINVFLLIVLFIVLATLAVFWRLGSRANEAQQADLERERAEKKANTQKENIN